MAKKPIDSAVQHWTTELNAARKREKEWRKDGERIIAICYGEKQDTPFNILYSNTETLLPALYSAIPRPVVDRRFKDEDPVGKEAARAGERGLSFMLDTNIEGYETFDQGMKAAVLDGLLPGRGVTCVKYDAEIGELPTDSIDDEEPAGESAEQENAEQPVAEPDPYKKSELVCIDARSWNRMLFGYAKKWSKVPWVAYEEHVDREEAERLFGPEIAAKLKYTEPDKEEDDNKKNEHDDKGDRKLATIYQIWDREGGKKIRYYSEQYKEGFLKVEDDPLGLTGFFNCPKPLQFIERSNDLTPTALYTLYESQAKELNQLTLRISKIVRAIKARGIYDSMLGDDLKMLMEGDDNELVPGDKSASLAAEGGIQNAIWFLPIEQLVKTLQQLYQARESCKQTIYEITGIADIMRGQTAASETLGAQEIKNQWGTLRLQRLQNEVQRYARDLLRMMLEIAANKFGEETWAKMTGLPYLTEQKFQELQSIVAAATPAAQAGDQQAAQALQQAQQQLQQPQWSQILGLLKDDLQRAYRIDIETNSTVVPEAVEDQKNISEVMTALGQFLNGVGPLIQRGVMPFQAAQSMMLAIVRRFRFGPEIEDYVKQMQQPKPEDDGSQQQAQMEREKHEADMKQKAADFQRSQATASQQADIEQQRMTMEQQKMAQEAEFAAKEHEYKMAELAGKMQLTRIVTDSKVRVAMATAASKEAQAQQPVVQQ
jgi:hypothetical protein